jgi:hypothetical protein
MGFKIFVVLLLVLILFSLASGFFFLVYRKSPSDKAMVNSLTVRIGLSVALFLMLFIAWYLGYIQPHPPLPS